MRWSPPTKRMLCTCVSEYQDKKFGKNKRSFNRCDGGSLSVAGDKYRCTVCGTEK